MTQPVDTLHIAIAQLDPTVGDVAGNLELVRRTRDEARLSGADLVVFSELFLCGYPPGALLRDPDFLATCRAAVETLAAESAEGPALLLGTPWVEEGRLYNAVVLLEAGAVAAVRHKVDLSRSAVFDETLVFTAGALPGPIPFKGVRLGVPVGGDIYGPDVVECLAETGAELLITLDASPYSHAVYDARENMAVSRVVESHLPLIYVNALGGQDDWVFDGSSFALNADCFLTLQFPSFRERVRLMRWERIEGRWTSTGATVADHAEDEEGDYAACVRAVRDHVVKNGYSGVVLNLAGGVASVLCAMLAVDALGPQKVACLALLDGATTPPSLDYAAGVAEALGVGLISLPLDAADEGLEGALSALFASGDDAVDVALTGRVRAAALMSAAAGAGALALVRDCKSDLFGGADTPDGAVTGGFAPLKDLYETEVLRLARLRNHWKPDGALGPERLIVPDQMLDAPAAVEPRRKGADGAVLPPHDLLDPILFRLVELGESVAQVAADGFDPALVRRVVRLIAASEGRRRGVGLGVTLSLRGLERAPRFPVSHRFRAAD